MQFSVDFYAVMGTMIAVLAAVALMLRYTLLSGKAPLLLGVGLAGGALVTWLFAVAPAHPLTLVLFALFEPLTIALTAQATRMAFGLPAMDRRAGALAIGLVALSIVLPFFPLPPHLQTMPFGVAIVVVILDLLVALWRSERNLFNRAIFVAWGAFLIGCAVRMPFFPALIGAGAAYPGYANPQLQWFLLLWNSVTVPAVVFAVIGKLIAKRIADLREISTRDGLTGLLNRRAFEEVLRPVDGRTGVLLLADLDHFKQVNDRFGHGVGDDVLRDFAAMCQRLGCAGRIGGEEFAVALPGASLLEAHAAAEALRREFAAYSHDALDPDERLSASFGLAAYRADDSFDDILRRADDALYVAKDKGRDRVMIDDRPVQPLRKYGT